MTVDSALEVETSHPIQSHRLPTLLSAQGAPGPNSNRGINARLMLLDGANGPGSQLRPDLMRSGFDVHSVSNVEQLYLGLSACDLVLLAASGHRASPHDLILDISRRSSVGIVMVADAADVSDRILALEFGADEYLSTPFDPREAVARIRALTRRLSTNAASSTHGFRVHGWRLDLITRRFLSDDGHEIRLTSREFEVLALLLENANQPVAREQIQGSSHSYHDSRAADALVGRLRKKLRQAGIREEIIRPIRSIGYVLSASVSRE